MSMVKIVNPAGWDFDRPIAQQVHLSQQGLTGQDRRDFIKVASPAFVNVLDNIKVAKDEIPVHLIALGASEAYGPNRNGDGFKEATCKKHYKTFEKHARWYRNHVNKDPAKSYGYIKAAAYNDAMRRVELLVMLNATKQAAERNGGLVADRELEKLAKNEDIPVSMACRVPFDVCSGCGNRARTRSDYCTTDTCKYGGCKSNLTKVAEDGHILHVDNPDPTWFDISDVFRPADRIAYGAKADWLSKAASADEFTPGAAMAEYLGVTAPLGVILSQDDPHNWSASINGQVKLAYALALLERQGPKLAADTLRAFDPHVQGEILQEQLMVLGRPGGEKCAEALGALADNKIILPLRDFAKWIGKEAAVRGAHQLLPGAFDRFVEQGNIEARITHNRYMPSTKTASAAQRILSRNLREKYGLDDDAIRTRSMLSSIRGLKPPTLQNVLQTEKIASAEPEVKTLVEDYTLYKLAALHRIAATDQNFHLTGRLAIGQNWV
jgi:hypothetical protein